MKKILVILVATLISVGAYAQQPEKGKLYIGTSLMTPLNGDLTFGTGFNYNQVKDVVKTTTFGLAPGQTHEKKFHSRVTKSIIYI